MALWAWAPIARGQDAPAQPDRVITEQSSAANQTTPSGERSDPSPGAADDPPPPAMFPHFRDTRLWLSGQANFIFQMRYGRENIFETYYTTHVWRGIYTAPGLQHIVDPGYNRDRGPVLVPSFRLHLEF